MFRNIQNNIVNNLWTPDSKPPPGYKLVIHRYYTEVVPVGYNIPKTPVKTGRFVYEIENNNNNNNLKIYK